MKDFTNYTDYFRAITGKNYTQWGELEATARKLFDLPNVTGLHFELMPYSLDGSIYTDTKIDDDGNLVTIEKEVVIEALKFIVTVKVGTSYLPFIYEVTKSGNEYFWLYGDGVSTKPTNLETIIESICHL